MRTWKRVLYVIGGVVGVVVLVSAAAQAARQDSWLPLETVAWVPAMLIAAWVARDARCRPQRRQSR